MFQWFFQGNDYLSWPLFGLGIFIISFLLVLLYVFVGLRGSETINRMASLPLDDDAGASLRDEGGRE